MVGTIRSISFEGKGMNRGPNVRTPLFRIIVALVLAMRRVDIHLYSFLNFQQNGVIGLNLSEMEQIFCDDLNWVSCSLVYVVHGIENAHGYQKGIQ